MAVTVTEIRRRLGALVEVQGVLAALSATDDGFLIASIGATNVHAVHAEGVAAESAFILGTATAMSRFLDMGRPSVCTLAFRRGFILTAVFDGGVVAVVADPRVNQAMLRMRVLAVQQELNHLNRNHSEEVPAVEHSDVPSAETSR